MRFIRTALSPLLALSIAGGTAVAATGTVGATSKPATSPTIVIGNEGFGESYIMQDIYGDLLQRAGYTVKLLAQASATRQVEIPALEAGSIDLVPDYAGSLLVYLAADDTKQAGTLASAETALNSVLAPKGAAALAGTVGLDQNVFVVTAAEAAKDHLTTIASLKPYASKWNFGAPAECSTNYFCAPGLKKVYGISFKSLNSYDEGGPTTVAALKSGAAEVVELFSTDSTISQNNFVELKDNLDLEPADHLIPVIRKSFDTAKVRTALAAVNSLLTTSELTTLDSELSSGSHPTPATVAKNFLKAKGL